ncbi:MAG: tRNA (adenosine(37)-N6)-dimethylallyltransferase MiaA [Candidatus Omnitrophota bacterium]
MQLKSTKQPVIFIVGPTASGKSEVAVELAKKINGEIISADSMQVYRGMDILSAKPSEKLLKKVPHHLIDILNPEEEYSAAIFCAHAQRLIKEISERKKIPIIAGGTGLYVKSLTRGLFADGGKDPLLRKELRKTVGKKGSVFLHERLKEVDPQAAERIHPNDSLRIIRALEAYEINKESISSLQTKTEGIGDWCDYKLFGLEWDRWELYSRIEQRVDEMFEAGIVEEVKKLRALSLSRTAAQGLGIKQIGAYLNNECSQEEAKDILKRDSRRYAKRQLTWFRQQEPSICWIAMNEEITLKSVICHMQSAICRV